MTTRSDDRLRLQFLRAWLQDRVLLLLQVETKAGNVGPFTVAEIRQAIDQGLDLLCQRRVNLTTEQEDFTAEPLKRRSQLVRRVLNSLAKKRLVRECPVLTTRIGTGHYRRALSYELVSTTADKPDPEPDVTFADLRLALARERLETAQTLRQIRLHLSILCGHTDRNESCPACHAFELAGGKFGVGDRAKDANALLDQTTTEAGA